VAHQRAHISGRRRLSPEGRTFSDSRVADRADASATNVRASDRLGHEMIRLLLTTVFCALASLQAGAQNKVSETLLALGQEERNETFTDLLRDGDVKCDRVIRTLFNGATSDLDVWEALCRDRNSYSLTILSDPNADIALVSCRELRATSKMLLDKAGSRTKPTGCRIERAERQHRR
jgi:hypothetical protein